MKRTYRRSLGVLLVSIPFITLFFITVQCVGIKMALQTFGFVIGMVVCIGIGFGLTVD